MKKTIISLFTSGKGVSKARAIVAEAGARVFATAGRFKNSVIRSSRKILSYVRTHPSIVTLPAAGVAGAYLYHLFTSAHPLPTVNPFVKEVVDGNGDSREEVDVHKLINSIIRDLERYRYRVLNPSASDETEDFSRLVVLLGRNISFLAYSNRSSDVPLMLASLRYHMALSSVGAAPGSSVDSDLISHIYDLANDEASVQDLSRDLEYLTKHSRVNRSKVTLS